MSAVDTRIDLARLTRWRACWTEKDIVEYLEPRGGVVELSDLVRDTAVDSDDRWWVVCQVAHDAGLTNTLRQQLLESYLSGLTDEKREDAHRAVKALYSISDDFICEYVMSERWPGRYHAPNRAYTLRIVYESIDDAISIALRLLNINPE